MSTAWIPTFIRWTALVLVVWMGYQALPGMVDQFIDWRREESCIARGGSWQPQDFAADDYECVEKVETDVR
jgi:hypothetical protein